jgi:hypothetical protein
MTRDSGACTLYEACNREERAICAHLFRLLLNSQHKESEPCFFVTFLRLFADSGLPDPAVAAALQAADTGQVRKAGVYAEVALIRDVYAADGTPFGALTAFCRRHNEKNPGLQWSERQLLSVKPDLAIVVGGVLLVIEAKFTLGFDKEQLARTASLVSAWRCLGAPMRALGLAEDAPACVAKLGGLCDGPHVAWEAVADAAVASFGEEDPSVKALLRGCGLLRKEADDEGAARIAPGYVVCKGLAELAEHVVAHPGGYVGMAGGGAGLATLLEDTDYLLQRRYKWLPGVEASGLNQKNWLRAETFLARVAGVLVSPQSET